ncbi:Uncharacterized protein conserved in bacteria (DUF2064) [Seminavis robusta]|uniref:Uncharacterized protein conserved in bacteria (DUF2064) n=1 Tax=Seminavis robusta TaxID=568900 RepID=A0A9N8HU25_9STRA|nr:Uncharacterized protein conserved in bacteria (DUF2064) [Seminavis robusta]|eukprot:Sro1593_g284490.1 Uncharacterized protein conserved in bacteria (DUF2064) (301) ;mRNA; f:5864-6862
MDQASDNPSPLHTIVVVAKCPIPGKSKTRLIPKLKEEGSAKLAKAMLSDVLITLSECAQLAKVRKILFYAPANDQGKTIMNNLLQELDLSTSSTTTTSSDHPQPRDWMLLPMISQDLTSPNLGDILTDILQRTRALQNNGNVVFLGMDSPELPMEEIVAAINNNQQHAVLCPANDGGYGMLSVPRNAPADRIFQGIRWSDPLTALGQIKALTDANIPVQLGRLMNDIDEEEDLEALCQRLLATAGKDDRITNANEHDNQQQNGNDDVLLQSSSGSQGPSITGSCPNTRQILQELNLLSTP